MNVSKHAIDRYCEVYSSATNHVLLDDFRLSESITKELVTEICGRKKSRTNDSHYFLSKEKTGIFVVSDDNIIITFLRLSPMQQKIFIVTNKEDKITINVATKVKKLKKTDEELLQEKEAAAIRKAAKLKKKEEMGEQRYLQELEERYKSLWLPAEAISCETESLA